MENPSTRYSTAERLVSRLPHVSACSIEIDESGEIAAIHVTAMPGLRSPKRLARNIESTLKAEEGLFVDHRKISIATLGDGDVGVRAAVTGLQRLSLVGVGLHQGDHGLEVEVTLASGSAQATGRATGSNTRFEVRRTVGQAALDAVSRLADGAPRFSLGEIEETELGSRRILVVCVNRAQGREEAHLIGCCEIGYDPTQAVIFAVLDALNRFVGTLRPREPVEFRIGPVHS